MPSSSRHTLCQPFVVSDALPPSSACILHRHLLLLTASSLPASQKTLARVAERAASGEFGYNKFFAIGLFRLLEVGGG